MNVEKNIEDKTLAEAKAEFRYWDDKVQSAPYWGASLAAADEFRRAAKKRIEFLQAKGDRR